MADDSVETVGTGVTKNDEASLPRIDKTPKDGAVITQTLKEPVPVFIGKTRQLGTIKAMEKYAVISDEGDERKVPGNGETVYLCSVELPRSARLTLTCEAKDLMLR